MEFLLEENAMLRETLRRITQRIQDELTDATPMFNAGIVTALTIISEESGVPIHEILQPQCR